MIENFFSIPLVIFYALFFGVTMKIADLLDEHGLRWFKGDAIIFGFIWGLFGILLVLSNNVVANLMVAMCLAFVIRNRLDYLNHQIASVMIIISFLFVGILIPKLFLIFFGVFLIFGALRDYSGDVLIKKEHKKGFVKIYDSVMWYYPIPTLIYCILYGDWIIFFAFAIYTLGFDLTKYLYKRAGYS